MDTEELKARTKEFALRTIRLAESLPKTGTGGIVRGQIIRCGTSVGANYRAACRAKSPADFISKMGTVEEEADETVYWMEIIADAGLMPKKLLRPLMDEADEILSIVVSSIRTAKKSK